MPRHHHRAPLLLLLGAALAACEQDDAEERFHAVLSGQSEVPARSTPASGTAHFAVRDDNTIDYALDVSGIRNVTAAHIHGPAGPTENRGVIVNLFVAPGPTPDINGTLAMGRITATNASQQIKLDSLLVLMRNGMVYVNVHTNDLNSPPNSGPGDFPGGELRGQIMRGPR